MMYINKENKYKVDIVKSASETDNLLTLIKINVEPGGGNNKHIHSGLTETFKVIKGEIAVRNGDKFINLKAGEILSVNANTAHHFINKSSSDAEFLVVIMPGSLEFEQEVLSGADL
jgi:quercetin dioxygenase-like cupin family protein